MNWKKFHKVSEKVLIGVINDHKFKFQQYSGVQKR